MFITLRICVRVYVRMFTEKRYIVLRSYELTYYAGSKRGNIKGDTSLYIYVYILRNGGYILLKTAA